MAGSVNKVILVGHVGKDPEIRSTQAGKKIASLSVATSERWKDNNSGEWRERTEWHRVICFNDGLSGVVERYIKKGSMVYIEGQLQTRKWQDQQGVDRYSTEVVLKGFNGSLTMLSKAENSGANNTADHSGKQEQVGGDASHGLDDEVPF